MNSCGNLEKVKFPGIKREFPVALPGADLAILDTAVIIHTRADWVGSWLRTCGTISKAARICVVD